MLSDICRLLLFVLQPESLRSLRKASEDGSSNSGGTDSPHAHGATAHELHHASLKVASWSSQNGMCSHLVSVQGVHMCVHAILTVWIRSIRFIFTTEVVLGVCQQLQKAALPQKTVFTNTLVSTTTLFVSPHNMESLFVVL